MYRNLLGNLNINTDSNHTFRITENQHLNKGFTLIELILGLFFISVLLPIIISILLIMVNYELPIVTQIEVFELQYRQLLIREGVGSCEPNLIKTHKHEIYYDKNRIVKSPGYEILLFDVSTIHFNCNDNILEVRLTNGYQSSIAW